MTKDKERDDALIAEVVETLRDVRDGVGCQPGYINTLGLRRIDAMLAKLQPAPKPDRAEALAWMIEGLFAEAADNPCTCASDENSCPHCNAWERATKQTRACIVEAFNELRAEWEAERPAGMVTQANYEAAVKGRQDFRNAYRKLLPVLRAAEALSVKWRTKGQKVDSSDFFDAINAVDVAVTGGGATPIPFADLPDAEGPAVVVPSNVQDSVNHIIADYWNGDDAKTLARFVKSLDGAKGGE